MAEQNHQFSSLKAFRADHAGAGSSLSHLSLPPHSLPVTLRYPIYINGKKPIQISFLKKTTNQTKKLPHVSPLNSNTHTNTLLHTPELLPWPCSNDKWRGIWEWIKEDVRLVEQPSAPHQQHLFMPMRR